MSTKKRKKSTKASSSKRTKKTKASSSSSSSSSDKKSNEEIISFVHELWNRLEKNLKEKRPGIFESLNPPATDEEIKEFEKNLGFPLPLELQTLYKIHNGQNEEKTNSVEDFFLHPIEWGSVWFPLSQCQTPQSPDQLDFLTLNMDIPKTEEEKKEAPPSPPPSPPPVRSGRGQGGKGFQTTDNPLASFVGFISNHTNNDSVECCGFVLGYDKKDSSTTMYRWHGQMSDVLQLEPKGNFLKWFEACVKEMENPTEDNDNDNDKDDDEEAKEDDNKKKLSERTSIRLKKMNCIITGLFDPYEPQEVADYIIRNGGKVSQNVTGTVTHMVLGKPGVIPPYNTKTGKGSKKYREAKKKEANLDNGVGGIPIMSGMQELP